MSIVVSRDPGPKRPAAGQVAVAALVEAARAGSQQAFSELVVRFQTLVFSVAWSMIGSVAEAEETAQDTFVSAWREIGDLQRPDRFRNWICGIARHLSLNKLRARRRRFEDGDEDSTMSPGVLRPATEIPSSEPSPLDHVISREEEVLLQRVLAAIPETYRVPLVLFYMEHQSVERVAQLLDLSVENVRQRLSRGRRLLYSRLATVIESALNRVRLGPGFTAAILATLAIRTTPAEASGAVPTRALLSKAAVAAATMIVVTGALHHAHGTPSQRAADPFRRPAALASLPASPSSRLEPPRFDMLPFVETLEAGRSSSFLERLSVPVAGFDFEDGMLPETFSMGHVVSGPRRPGSRHALMGTMAPTASLPLVAIRFETSGVGYRDTLVLRFDHWVSADAGDEICVTAWSDERQCNFFTDLKGVPRTRWAEASVPLSHLRSRRCAGPAEPGDPLTRITIYGGRLGGSPFYVDNVVLVDGASAP